MIGSIRHNGLRKATVEFDEGGDLVQIQGRGNRTVSAEIADPSREPIAPWRAPYGLCSGIGCGHVDVVSVTLAEQRGVA